LLLFEQLVGQVVLVPSHAKVPQAGDGVAPSGEGMQLPSEPGLSQLSQGLVQALLQQKRSTQVPFAQSLLALQDAPCGFFLQLPEIQKKPEAHWLSPEHEVGQLAELPPQTKGEQLGEPAAPRPAITQVPPAPVQLSQAPAQAVVQQTLSAQNPDAHAPPPPAPQLCPLSSLQLPAPSHELLPAQAPGGELSSAYCAMLTQVPPTPVHDWQTPQVVEQQWLSMQATAHWLSVEQVAP
jgi:hypothetical protein